MSVAIREALKRALLWISTIPGSKPMMAVGLAALNSPDFEPMSAVDEFHQNFHLDYRGKPRVLPEDLADFRIKFMQEELNEYIAHATAAEHELSQPSLAIDRANLTFHLAEMLDALVDLTYVALGTAHLHGFDFREAFRRVHAANMLKIKAVRKEQSLRGSTHDVIKPPGWEPPSHTDLVEDHIHKSAPTGG